MSTSATPQHACCSLRPQRVISWLPATPMVISSAAAFCACCGGHTVSWPPARLVLYPTTEETAARRLTSKSPKIVFPAAGAASRYSS